MIKKNVSWHILTSIPCARFWDLILHPALGQWDHQELQPPVASKVWDVFWSWFIIPCLCRFYPTLVKFHLGSSNFSNVLQYPFQVWSQFLWPGGGGIPGGLHVALRGPAHGEDLPIGSCVKDHQIGAFVCWVVKSFVCCFDTTGQRLLAKAWQEEEKQSLTKPIMGSISGSDGHTLLGFWFAPIRP